MIRNDRTDLELTKRHITMWGDCYCTDLDHVLIEYDWGKPYAIVENKYHLAQDPKLQKNRSLLALLEIARRCQLPFWIAFYWREPWAFRVRPMNGLARNWFEPYELLTERQYVRRLRMIQGNRIQPSVDTRLDDRDPPTHRRRCHP